MEGTLNPGSVSAGHDLHSSSHTPQASAERLFVRSNSERRAPVDPGRASCALLRAAPLLGSHSGNHKAGNGARGILSGAMLWAAGRR